MEKNPHEKSNPWLLCAAFTLMIATSLKLLHLWIFKTLSWTIITIPFWVPSIYNIFLFTFRKIKIILKLI